MSRADTTRRRPLQYPRLKLAVLMGLWALPLLGLIGAWLHRHSALAAVVYLLASVLAYALYGYDKRQAGRNGRRTPENILHAVELCGGWPGALIAQQQFRHKTRKASYLVVFWTIVFLHQAFWFYELFYARR